MNSIVAAVDDLMFSSRIATAAKQMGIELAFARSPQDRARPGPREESGPDHFRSQRNQAGSHRDDRRAEGRTTAFAPSSTLGFVSHVDSRLITAARAAGIDEVLARSAFTARLGEILTTG